MADLISASSLAYAPDLITELGGEPAILIARAGIDPAVSGARDHYIRFSALAALLTACAAELDTPDFALRLAARQSIDILGPVAVLAQNAANATQALRGVIRFAHVYSPAIASRLDVAGSEATLEFAILERRVGSRAQAVERALAVMLLVLKALCGSDFRPTRVTFQHDQVSARDVYLDHFHCPVDFGEPRNLMSFPAGVLRGRLRGDPLLYDMAVRYMVDRAPDAAFDAVVTAHVRQLLTAGTATLAAVASLMAVHPRTVQRHLKATGRTFESVVDDVRRDLALDLLADNRVPLSVVARRTGYSEQSCLTRSCRRWFGMTAMAKRRALASNAERESQRLTKYPGRTGTTGSISAGSSGTEVSHF